MCKHSIYNSPIASFHFWGLKRQSSESVVRVSQIQVFSNNVVENSEVTSGKTRIGDYDLNDLVLLDNRSFGVIIRVENEGFQVLKGVHERPEIVVVRLREIMYKIERKNLGQDRSRNIIAVKDVVKVLDGPSKGKQYSLPSTKARYIVSYGSNSEA